MRKRHLYKTLLAVGFSPIMAMAQGGYQKKDTAFRAVHSLSGNGLWVLIFIILAALLVFSYLLTRAIDKRTNK